MFEFVDDLSSEDLDNWILKMGASVEYLEDGVWAVSTGMIPCDGTDSRVDKASAVKDNKAVERVG